MALTPRPPAAKGATLPEVDTPAALVDMAALERNMAAMKKLMDQFPHMRLRPHAKAHKCAEMAKRQLAAGASGVCCQKLYEAEAMLHGGVTDILLTNEVVGAAKLERLTRLVAEFNANIDVLVDDVTNVGDLNAAAAKAGVTIGAYVEVNVGQNRCGVEPGSDALKTVAQAVYQASHLKLRGLQCYQGALQHVRDWKEKEALLKEVVSKSRLSKQTLEDANLPCNMITGCGTGSFQIEGELGLHGECQAGSYIFLDADYGRNKDKGDGLFQDFEHSLFVHTTVMSRAADGSRLVLDAGLKAVSWDSGAPVPVLLSSSGLRRFDDVEVLSGGDEHIVIKPPPGSPLRDLTVGCNLQFIPGHCDPTVNLHTHFVCIREGLVEDVWPIAGRGPGV